MLRGKWPGMPGASARFGGPFGLGDSFAGVGWTVQIVDRARNLPSQACEVMADIWGGENGMPDALSKKKKIR